MADPQIENGHTKIANELVEAFARHNLSAYESRLLWVVFRKTYGWNKKADRISYSQFEEATGIDRRHIGRGLNALKSKGILVCSGAGYALEYAIQKNYELWGLTPKEAIGIDTERGNDLTPKEAIAGTDNLTPIQGDLTPIQGDLTPKEESKSLPESVYTKDNKDTLQKTLYKRHRGLPKTELPDWIDGETWGDYIEMRKTQKKPPTPGAIKLIISKLQKLRDAGDDPNEVLRQSIISGWTGVFPLKERNGKTHHSRKLPTYYEPTADYPDL